MTITAWLRRFRHTVVAGAAALGCACQAAAPALAPVAPPAAGLSHATLVLGADRREAIKQRLSGAVVNDFVNATVAAASRWRGEAAARPAARRLQALGAPANSNWTGGLNINAAPISCSGDMATNGFASRVFYNGLSNRVYVITRNGVFLELDPANPTVGFTKTTLAGTFTKTYVTLSGNGAAAFVINDAGRVFAIDLVTTGTPATTRNVRSLTLLGTPATVGAALFADPVLSPSNSMDTTLFVCDNAGAAHRVEFHPGAGGWAPGVFSGATFAEVGAPVQLTTATPLSGGAKIKSPPVVLNGKLVVGDRAGNVILYDYNVGGSPRVVTANYGWPIETPIAVDVDDDLNPLDYFAAAGAQLIWIKPDGTVYTGQYALLETTTGATSGTLDYTTFAAHLNTTASTVTATSNWQAFSSAKSASSNAGTLPNTNDTPPSLDNDNLTSCEFVTGAPPTIWQGFGQANRPFYNTTQWNTGATTTINITNQYAIPGSGTSWVSLPVTDGTSVTTAQLQGPAGLDLDADGSIFVADTNHCQLLFKPGSPTSWQNWYPAGAMSSGTYSWLAAASAKPNAADATDRFYVMAGTLYPNAPNNDGVWSGADDSDSTNAAYNGLRRDLGNGAGGPGVAGGSLFTSPAQCDPAGVVARGTGINRAQGVAVGELGLYIGNRNIWSGTGTNEGQVLWLPRANLSGTFWGIANPQAGRMYVICNQVDPQGLDVWSDPSATQRDVVFAPSTTAGSSASQGRVLKLDSTTQTSGTAWNTRTIGGTYANPYDCAIDDYGNLFIADGGNNALYMISQAVPPKTGAPVRNWGTAGVAGAQYTIMTGLTNVRSVTFAANDPQVPTGCLYIGLGANYTGTDVHRIIRLDETGAHQSAAGPTYVGTAFGNYAPAESADSVTGAEIAGTASTTRLAVPWRARGDGNGVTYVCDRGNNRIRKLISTTGASNAAGYMCLPVASSTSGSTPLGKPFFQATLRAYCKLAVGTMTPPEVGLASPVLRTSRTSWSDATLTAAATGFTPTEAPDIDLATARALPSFPSLLGTWAFLLSPGGNTAPYYEWKLPAQAIFTSSTDTRFQHLRIGLTSPTTDSNTYYYPSSLGSFALPNAKSPNFYTNNGALASQRPYVSFYYGNKAITYPILSPPAIAYVGGSRYVYLMNANALWRYDVTSPSTFIGANGAAAAFTKTSQGRAAGKGTLYAPSGAFMFNSTPPVIGPNNEVWALDCYAASATSYAFELNKLDGNLPAASTNMWLNSAAAVASGVAGTAADNGGIYMVPSDVYCSSAYMGLANGMIYHLSLQ